MEVYGVRDSHACVLEEYRLCDDVTVGRAASSTLKLNETRPSASVGKLLSDYTLSHPTKQQSSTVQDNELSDIHSS